MRLRIYLVEDNPVIQRNLIESLQELAGAVVVGVATTESEAKKWLAEHQSSWELAVVDLFLEEGTGLGVVSSCRDRRLEQKVVVLSNYATEPIRQQALARGANAVFDKSNELDEFMQYATDEVDRALGETRW
jgi:two-component system, OmpR family, response regulator